MTVTFGSTAIINYSFSLVMGLILLPGDFGLLAFIQTVLVIGAMIVGSGISWSLASTLAACPLDQRAPLIRGALIVNLLLGLLVAALLMLLFAWGPLEAGLETWRVTFVLALTLVLISIVSTTAAAMQGTGHFGAVAAIQGSEIVSKAACGVLLTLHGSGVFGAIAGFAIGAAVGSVVGLYSIYRELRVRLWGTLTLPKPHTTGSLFVSLFALAFLQNLDLTAVKLFSGDRTLAGYYQAATILATAPYFFVSSAIVPILVPQLARRTSLADTQPIILDAFRLLAALIIPIEVVLAIIPRQVLEIFFTGKYTEAAPTLRILAIGNSTLMAVIILAAAYQSIGRAHLPAVILASIVAFETIILRVGVPRWHNIGASTSFSLAASAAFTVLLIAYIRSVSRNNVRTLGRWLSKWIMASAIGMASGSLLILIGAPIITALGVGITGYFILILQLRLIKRPLLGESVSNTL